jgi:hypothetical protein
MKEGEFVKNYRAEELLQLFAERYTPNIGGV